MNLLADKVCPIYQKSAHAVGLSAPPIGCVLDLPGLPGGGNKIYDRSPYGNNGTITGATWRRLPSGLWYLDFDGSDDYVTLGSPSHLNTINAITIHTWIRQDSFSVGSFISKYGSSERCYALRQDTSTIFQFRLTDDGSHKRFDVTYTLPEKQWICLDAVFDGKDRIFYANTEEKGRDTPGFSTIYAGTQPLLLGGYGETSPSEYAPCQLARTRIYNRPLSPLEIQNRYQQEKYLFGVV